MQSGRTNGTPHLGAAVGTWVPQSDPAELSVAWFSTDLGTNIRGIFIVTCV